MAKNNEILDASEKARLLRAVAFQAQRKQPVDEVLLGYVQGELQRGRRKEYRPVMEALQENGAVASMLALGLIGEETGILLSKIIEHKDHRLLADSLNALSDRWESA